METIHSRLHTAITSLKLKLGVAQRGRSVPKEALFRKMQKSVLEFHSRLELASSALRGEVRPYGGLSARVIRADGTVEDKGLISTKLVTTVGVNYLVDALQNLVEPENLRFHGSGTSSTAEAVGDTALGAEVETRATGSQLEGASANIYKTVGTIAYTATRAIVEHGIFSASTAGTLLDRSVFAVINVNSGDSIEFTYELTIPAGG